MRLIDADNIPYTMLYKENRMKGTGKEAQGAWKRDIDKMPTVDPVRHGHWINRGDNSWECSECHEISCCTGNYCVDCGAIMDEVKE